MTTHRSTGRSGRRGWLLLASGLVLSLLSGGLVVHLVRSAGTQVESNTFQFKGVRAYLLSHPLCSSFTTAADLQAALLAQNPSETGLTIDAAVMSQTAGNPQTFHCFPSGSTFIEDWNPVAGARCDTTTDTLSFTSREAVLIRINDVSCAGDCITLHWSGTDSPPASYSLSGGAAQWISIPFSQTPLTAGDVLDDLAPTGGGTVIRILPTLPGSFQFWNGADGNADPKNFAVSPGEGLQILSNVNESSLLNPLPGASVSGTVTQGVTSGAPVPLQFRQVLLMDVSSGVILLADWTDELGQYAFYNIVPPGSYDVSIAINPGENWTPATGTIAVNPISSSDNLTGNDFVRGPLRDLSVNLYRTLPVPLRAPCSTAVSPGNQMDYCLRFSNVGGFDENAARLVLDLPPTSQATFLSSSVGECANTIPPVAPTVVGTQLTWNVSAPFEPGDACTVCAAVEILPPTGDFLPASASIWLDATNQDGFTHTRNNDSRSERDVCSVDPNDKQVTPSGCGDAGFISRGNTLTYLVRFQNNGSAPATRVEITDILDGALDQSTIRVVDASHLLTGLALNPGRRLVFTFDNINLPPEFTDPEGSQGFILFKIDPTIGLPSGTKIPNGAGIVFDLNAPVITNTVINTITDHAIPVSGEASAEVCNNIDDDCDGTVDNFVTSCGAGACNSAGACVAGFDSCVPGTPQPETCNNLDDDCDGVVDGFATTCGFGTCAGAGTCVAGIDSCAVNPSSEVCDGLDNDCDGIIDQGAIAIMAARHVVGVGSHPGSTKEPLVGIAVCAYDKDASSCAVDECGGVSHLQYTCIVSGDGTSGPCAPVNCCTTDASGHCALDVPPGNYLVISDDATKTVLPDPLGVTAGAIACGDLKQKHLQQIVRADGKKISGKTTRLTGSELLIIEPEFIVWDETQQLYPFVFEAVGDWVVTAAVTPPEGFVADEGSLSEVVDSTIEAVQFTITEIGSDLVPTGTFFEVSHKGRRTNVRSQVDIYLTPAYARSRGFDLAILRAKGLIKEKKLSPRQSDPRARN